MKSIPLIADGSTRRDFLRQAGVLAGSPLAAVPALAGDREGPSGAAAARDFQASAPVGAPIRITLHVNGRPRTLEIEARTTLLDALRDHLALTGTKKGCDRGQCGACTVLADGERIDACLALAVAFEDVEIVTIEGLGDPSRLHPLQAAFIAEDAFQCGYCTPGQVCSGVALLAEAARGDASAATADVRRPGPATLTEDEIRERMSGNLCRCGAYPNIVRAVKSQAGSGAGQPA